MKSSYNVQLFNKAVKRCTNNIISDARTLGSNTEQIRLLGSLGSRISAIFVTAHIADIILYFLLYVFA